MQHLGWLYLILRERVLTFDLENLRSGVCGVPVGFFAGFRLDSPLSALGRQPHGPSPSGLSLRHGASQTYRRLSDISSERRAHLVQLVVQLSGLFERVQAEGAAGVPLLVGVPLHLIDRFSADALEHFPG